MFFVALFSVLLNSPTCFAANDAVIRFGNSPMYGKELRVLSNDRVSYPLTDLEESGGGEDEEFVLACYEGDLADVCKIVEAAVAEENIRLRRSDVLRLKSCKFAKPARSFAPNSILVDIDSRKEGRFRFPQLTQCRK